MSHNTSSQERLVLYTGKAKDCHTSPAIGETLLDLAHNSRRAYGASIEVEKTCTSIGYYQSYNKHCKKKSREECVRRITGGATIALEAEWTHTTITIPSVESLKEAYKLATLLATCIYSAEIRGPLGTVNKKPLAIGVTRIEDLGYIEVLGDTPPPTIERLEACFRQLGYNPIPRPLETPAKYAEHRKKRYLASSWNKYSYKKLLGEALHYNRKGYWLRIGVEIVDGYIADWSLEGVLYSSPPPELFSILASVKGTPFHELTLEALIQALETRLETHGVEKKDIENLLKQLHSKHGVKHYT